MTHDYTPRHHQLFAALNVLNGKVIAQCQPHHQHSERSTFLRQIAREIPKDKSLHLIFDHYSTHKHPKVQQWAEETLAFPYPFPPYPPSWLNMVARFFRDLTASAAPRRIYRNPAINGCH